MWSLSQPLEKAPETATTGNAVRRSVVKQDEHQLELELVPNPGGSEPQIHDLLPCYVELLHHFLDAQVFKILDDGGDRKTGIAKDPRAAYLPRNALHGGTLRPI